MNHLDNKVREYLLGDTAGVVFPVGECPPFSNYCREVLGPDVHLWPVQKLILKTIINTIGLFPHIPMTREEKATLAEWEENARRPTEDNKYAQAVIRTDRRSPNPMTILLIIGRGSGKSFMASLLVSYFIRYLISLGDPHKAFGLARSKPISLQCFAGKERQAISLFRSVKTHSRNCHELQGCYEELKESLNFGNVVEAIACTSNSNTTRGEDTFCYYHEETAFCSEDNPQSEKSFTQCYAAIRPAVKNRFNQSGILLFVTSAGMKTGKTYQLYRQIKNGTIQNCVLFQLAVWNINPKYRGKEDFVQEYNEDPITADAEHGSQFVDSQNVFLTRDEVWRPILQNKRTEQNKGKSNIQYWIRIDPSRKHDRYALALGHKEYSKDRIVAVVDFVTYWQASWFDRETGEEVVPKNSREKAKYRCQPVNPQAILNYIEDLMERFNVVGISADQFESEYIISELNDRYGTDEEPFGFVEAITEKANWLAYRNLKKLINTDCFEMYHYPPYVEEALVAMRYNKNKPLETKPDELFGFVEDEWEDDDEGDAVDNPNLIYSVKAPTSGPVRTDDVLDAVTFLLWDMMKRPQLGIANLDNMGAIHKRETPAQTGNGIIDSIPDW